MWFCIIIRYLNLAGGYVQLVEIIFNLLNTESTTTRTKIVIITWKHGVYVEHSFELPILKNLLGFD